MASPVYSTRFLSIGPGGEGPFTYTPPSGYVASVRHMTFTPGTLAAFSDASALVVGELTTGESFWILNRSIVQTNRTYQWDGMEVITDANEMEVTFSSTDCSFSANGFLLKLP